MDSATFPLSRRRTFWAVIALLVASSVFAQVQLDKIRSSAVANVGLYADRLPQAIIDFERAIGYSGLIHAFKNHVLRPEESRYRDNAEAHFLLAQDRLGEIESLAATANLDVDIEALRNTLAQYRDALPEISRLAEQGFSPAQIDDRVRIDDTAAAAALTGMSLAIRVSFRETMAEQSRYLDTMIWIMATLAIALPAVIGGFAALRHREQRRRLDELRLLNDTLRHKNLELERSNQSLSDFAYAAAHDLRTPMRAIANHARFLAEDHAEALPKDARHRLNRMEELCSHTDAMVSQLHRYSRIDTEKQRVPVDCEAILRGIRLELSELTENGRAAIVQETPLPPVIGNPTEIATIFRHLIVNGLTYNRSATPTVFIGFAENGLPRMPRAFYVRDNGVGIDPDMHDEIFRIFKRLNPPAEFGHGHGAGLAFVKRAVESHAGDIRIVSEPGKGSTFLFVLHGTAAVGKAA